MTEFDHNQDRVNWLEATEPPVREDYLHPIVVELVNRRRQLGLTQEQLNIRLGMADRYVNKWECGMKTPNLYNLILWAEVLGLKLKLSEI